MLNVVELQYPQRQESVQRWNNVKVDVLRLRRRRNSTPNADRVLDLDEHEGDEELHQASFQTRRALYIAVQDANSDSVCKVAGKAMFENEWTKKGCA